MRKASLPIALVYGWDDLGELTLTSDVYYQEHLFESVIVYSYSDVENFINHFNKINPDIVLTIGGTRDDYKSILEYSDVNYITSKWIHREEVSAENILANIVVCEATRWACESREVVYHNENQPLFSVFTPTYKTNERIFRTYESLKNQTYRNWEWVVVDDSPEGDYKTFEYLKSIAEGDYRVKVYRMSPNSGGNIGEVKHRAGMLSNGYWLVELDHDDYLMKTALEDIMAAGKEYPDAGFIYTDCCELFEDGEMRPYGPIGKHHYGNRETNSFAFAYSTHEWETHHGKDYLVHQYCDINPRTIRFNISMPNHTRIWRYDVYQKMGGHNRNISVADDFELIVKTFLETKFIHIKKLLYLQYNNHNSTVDNNSTDINRKARLIRDTYDLKIHNRIQELGVEDWNWIEEEGHSHQLTNWMDYTRYFEREGVMNYVYVPEK